MHRARSRIHAECNRIPVPLEHGFTQSQFYRDVTTKNAVFLRVPPEYQGLLCGMCGNYNQLADDDLYPRDQQATGSNDAIGISWVVPNDQDSQ